MIPYPRFVCLLAGTALGLAPHAHGQLAVSAEGTVALVQHRVDAGLGLGIEQVSGSAFGGQGTVRIGQWVEVSGFGLTGTLNPDSALAEKRTLSEAEAVVSVTAVPWLAVQVGGNLRAYDAVLTTQRWVTGRIGAELRLDLAAGAFRGQIGGGIMPLTSVDGLTDPDLAFYAGAGVVWTLGPIRASARYVMERFEFPTQGGATRAEQLDRLHVGLGFGIGR